jgi:hypothetical protein
MICLILFISIIKKVTASIEIAITFFLIILYYGVEFGDKITLNKSKK